MENWTDSKGINLVLLRKWSKGHILVNALCENDFFPLKIKLEIPKLNKMGECFTEAVNWLSGLKKHSKKEIGYGYDLIEHEFNNSTFGKNTIPTYAVIPTLQDATKLIGKQNEVDLFLKNSEMLLGQWPELRNWIIEKPFKTLGIGENCDKIIKVLMWFETHENRALYIRQLDIEGVDTKFIETNKVILDEILTLILPAGQFREDCSQFEVRYGFKKKPEIVRFRILDKQFALDGLTDLSATAEEFSQITIPFQRVFIVENEINFLSFPQIPKSCVVFGRGYGVEVLANAHCLQGKSAYYWGDIDTHGFNILSRARAFLPQIKSFLMDEEILLSHRSLWVTEDKPFLYPIHNLTAEEYTLVCRLQGNEWGSCVRLEQERVRFSCLQKFIIALDD